MSITFTTLAAEYTIADGEVAASPPEAWPGVDEAWEMTSFGGMIETPAMGVYERADIDTDEGGLVTLVRCWVMRCGDWIVAEAGDYPEMRGEQPPVVGTVVASAGFANEWHDEIGRFAPKGTGSRYPFDPPDIEGLTRWQSGDNVAYSDPNRKGPGTRWVELLDDEAVLFGHDQPAHIDAPEAEGHEIAAAPHDGSPQSVSNAVLRLLDKPEIEGFNWREREPGMWLDHEAPDGWRAAYDRAAMTPEAQAKYDELFPGTPFAWQRHVNIYLPGVKDAGKVLSGKARSITDAKAKAEKAGQAEIDKARAKNDERMRRLFPQAATRVEFGNPWHDQLGRFAPKGTGKMVTSVSEDEFAEAVAGLRQSEGESTWGTPASAEHQGFVSSVHSGVGAYADPEVVQAWDWYANLNGYKDVSKYLRTGDGDELTKSRVELMTTAFTPPPARPLPGAMFRGETETNRPKLGPTLKPGDTFTDNGFASVSENSRSAQMFANYEVGLSDGPSRVIYMVRPTEATANTPVVAVDGREQEWALPRGSKFRVGNIIEHARQGYGAADAPSDDEMGNVVDRIIELEWIA